MPDENIANALAVILAREGSKGLTNKNACLLGGKPLLVWTIEHALGARSLTRTVLSTDGESLAELARDQPIDVIMRPAELATDDAPIQHAVRHALAETEREQGVCFDYVVILYANVPLRPRDLTDRALEKLRRSGGDSVQSLYPVGKTHPYWMKRLGGEDEDRLEAYQANTVFRRQDLPAVYMLDGGIIAVTRASLFVDAPGQPHGFLGTDRRAIVTEPGEVVDIDSALDLAFAEAILSQRDSVPTPPTVQPPIA